MLKTLDIGICNVVQSTWVGKDILSMENCDVTNNLFLDAV